MSLIKRMRKQFCVYWGSPVNDKKGGFTYGTPVELTCRWEDSQVKYVTAQGEDKVSKAIVYVSQDVDVGGFLWLGRLANIPTGSSTNPKLATGSGEIKNFSKLPNMKAKEFLRKAIL